MFCHSNNVAGLQSMGSNLNENDDMFDKNTQNSLLTLKVIHNL